jgi:hypothetical protein
MVSGVFDVAPEALDRSATCAGGSEEGGCEDKHNQFDTCGIHDVGRGSSYDYNALGKQLFPWGITLPV